MARLGVFELIDDRSDPPTIDVTSLSIAVEELARVDSYLAVTVHVQAMSAALFAQLAPAGLRRELLPKMTAGEEFVAFGLTEPSGGSDAGNIATAAVRDGDEWVINGAKQFNDVRPARAARWAPRPRWRHCASRPPHSPCLGDGHAAHRAAHRRGHGLAIRLDQ